MNVETMFDTITPMEQWKKMQTRSNGERRIRTSRNIGSAITLAPITESEANRTGFAFAQAVFDPTKAIQRTELSDDPIKQLVPKHERYIPEMGGTPFVPGSAIPPPMSLAQHSMETAGEVIALAVTAGRDPTSIKQLFNAMWGLPEDFDVGIYAPLVKPERTKPWLRYGKDSNYEVRYMKDAQCTIHVTNGDYTGVFKAKKKEIDWDKIRNDMRSLATNVFFTEPGVIEDLIAGGERVTMYFKLNPDAFDDEHIPQWKFDVSKFKPNFGLPISQVKAIMDFKPHFNKYAKNPGIQLLHNVPMTVLDQIRNQNENVILKAPISKAKINLNLPDLLTPSMANTVSVAVTTPHKLKKKLSIYEVMLHALKSWICTIAKNVPEVHLLQMYCVAEEWKLATDLGIKILPDELLCAAYRYYTESGVPKYEERSFKQLLNLIYGANTHYPYFTAMSILSIVAGAFKMKIYNFLRLFLESYKLATIKNARLTIFDLIRGVDFKLSYAQPVLAMKQYAYKNLAAFYVLRYHARLKTLQIQIKQSKTPEDRRKHIQKLLLLQLRIKVYPLMGYVPYNDDVTSALVKTAKIYIVKHNKDPTLLDMVNSLPTTTDYRSAAGFLDTILHLDLSNRLTDCELKSDETKEDLAHYEWDTPTYHDLIMSKRMHRVVKQKYVIPALRNLDCVYDGRVKPEHYTEVAQQVVELIQADPGPKMAGYYITGGIDDPELEDFDEVDTGIPTSLPINTLVEKPIIPQEPPIHAPAHALDMNALMGDYDDDDDFGNMQGLIRVTDFAHTSVTIQYPSIFLQLFSQEYPTEYINDMAPLSMLIDYLNDNQHTLERMEQEQRVKDLANKYSVEDIIENQPDLI